VLSAGHGRALLALRNEREMADVARDAMDHEWSVRETERRVRAMVERPPKPADPARDSRPAEVRRTEDHLRRHFATDVDIRLKGQHKGEIRIAFYSPEDFERLLDVLGTRPD
jgi:ParB family chromosome partitioning protein